MNFSAITDELIFGSMPGVRDYDTLRSLGVRLVINMRFDRGPELDPGDPPLDFLWLRTFDNPLLLIPLHTLHRGVRTALETIRAGGRVYTHCQHGRHRGVAMGAAVLIALGHSPEQAIRLIKERRPVADPEIFYIRNRIHRYARAYQAGD